MPSDRIERSTSLFYGDRFTLAVPQEWTDETVYHLERPSEKGSPLRVQVEVDPDAGNVLPVEYAEAQLHSQLRALEQARILDEAYEPVEGDGSAYRVLLSWQAGRSRRMQDQLYLVRTGVGFQVNVTCAAERRRRVRNEIEQLMDRFSPFAPLRVRRRS